jgi:hypothetical protein
MYPPKHPLSHVKQMSYKKLALLLKTILTLQNAQNVHKSAQAPTHSLQ